VVRLVGRGRGGGERSGLGGKTIGYRFPVSERFENGLSIYGSVCAMADRMLAPGSSGQPGLQYRDLRERVVLNRGATLLVFLVDTSDSMGGSTGRRISMAKGVMITWLRQARRRRDQVGMIGFGGHRADVVLPPTHSLDLAQRRLRELATGGATPLPDGLRKAHELVVGARRKDKGLEPVLILLSDGQANVSINPIEPAEQEALQWAERLRDARIRCIVLNMGAAARESAFLARLSARLGASMLELAADGHA
jgi:magnesium chelatase subunit D